MRKRQLNWKLLFWLVGVTAVSAGAVHFAHSAQMQRHARTLLAQAAGADAEGRFDHEAEYLKRYLTFNGGDTDALERYGIALDNTATSDVARSHAADIFEKVLARDRKRDAIRRRLIELYLELGRFTTKQAGWSSEARRHAELLTQALPHDSAAFVLLGRSLEADGEPTLARKSYEQAVKNDPHNIAAAVQLAQLLRRLKLTDDGEEKLTALVEANPREATAYLERGLYRMGNGALKEAAADLDAAHKLDPKDSRVLLALADLAQRAGNVAEARQWWQRGLADHDADPVMAAGLASLELQQAHPAAALAVLAAALKQHPSDPELNYLRTEALLEQHDFKVVATEIEELRSHDQIALANFLTAQLKLSQNRPLEAIDILEETLRETALPPGLAAHICLCLGNAYEQIGNGGRQLAYYRKAVELAPDLVRARVRLGAELLARGDTFAAVEQLSVAIRLPLPPDQARTLLARALLQHTLTLPANRRDWDAVAAALDQAGTSAHETVLVAQLRGDLLVARGRAADADAVLAKACAEQPQQAALWAYRARLAVRAGDFKRAAAILDEARGKLGDTAELRSAAIECWSGTEVADTLAFLRTQEVGLERFTPADRARLEAALAATYYRLGKLAEGDRVGHLLLAGLNAVQQGSDFADWVRLLDLALQGKDEKLIDAVATGLKEREGADGVWWHYSEAARRVVKALRGDRSGLTQAKTELENVTRRRPDWGRAALLQATVNDVAGDPTRALEGYLRAFNLGEHQLSVVERLVQLLAERGRLVEADEVMRRAQQQVIPRGQFARAAADIALRVGNRERAIVLARLAVPEGTTDPARVLWLGQMYAAAGHAPKAEALFRAITERAYDTEKKVGRYDPIDAWLILVAFLVRENRPLDAEAAIEQMRRQLPPEQLPFALGACYAALGKMKLAEENYRAALELRKNEALLLQSLASLYIRLNQADKAEPLLHRLLGPTVVTPEANLAWARRQLALLLADRGGDANYQDALTLLDENSKHGRPSAIDGRARAFVQATRSRDRAAALMTLQEARATQPLEPDELFRLARLTAAAEEDAPLVGDLLDELLRIDVMNPEYLAYRIADLLKHDNNDRARPLVERLGRLEGDSERVQRFRAQLQK